MTPRYVVRSKTVHTIVDTFTGFEITRYTDGPGYDGKQIADEHAARANDRLTATEPSPEAA